MTSFLGSLFGLLVRSLSSPPPPAAPGGCCTGTVSAVRRLRGLPTIYTQREFIAAGGLIGYGTSITDACRQAGYLHGPGF
jgi:hypothetical protein